jgi:acetyl-CoA carboxylase biotin carboxyl carrier protein
VKKPRRPSKPSPAGKKTAPSSGVAVPRSSPAPGDLTDAQRRYVGNLVELLQQHSLTELEMERDGVRVRLRREPGPASASSTAWDIRPASQDVAEETFTRVPPPATPSDTITVTSPIVGTFYRSPSPDADPYIEEGDVVKKGQVLCIVEAMKLMNEIESEVDGRVVKILAESTKAVEYGQPLFLIAPASAS